MRVPAICLSLLFALASAAPAAEKYLIEFGWDEPSTSFMRTHVTEMEQAPFDGTVYHIEYTKPDGTAGSFMNECWGTRAFTDQELQAAEENLKATHFSKFTQNFLRFNVIPGDLDWFDDYSAVVHNARQAARVASAAGSAGILFDIESYNGQLWRYSKQKRTKEHSWDDYCKQVESRGREVMKAFQDGWHAGGSTRPLVIFQTYGYCLPWQQADGDRNKLKEHGYGLLAPFMDGMYAVAEDGVTLVDGFESAYDYKTDAEFRAARQMVLEKIPSFVPDRERYLRLTSFGLGLWMDYDWRKNGWDANDESKNYFKPAEFGQSVKLALQYTDRYVWVYTEKPQWWTKSGGGPTGMMPAYAEAVARAKSDATASNAK